MIKLLVFDLDGVLVNTKDLHYESLNSALSEVDPKYIITRAEHYEKYDGLPTRRKLQLLTEDKNLPEIDYEQIYQKKQEFTFELIKQQTKQDLHLIEIFRQLKEEKYKIYVASNAIRETVKLLLLKTGLIEYVDYYLSNEDVKYSKPSAEIYLRCMIDAGVSPKETLIIEDSPRGIEAAQNAKANLLVVRNPKDVTYEKIKNEIEAVGGIHLIPEKLNVKNLNILIPMAGAGRRFADAGYTFPKPLIEVNNKPMIQVVTENLGFNANHIYVVQKEHYEKYNLKALLNLITPNCQIVQVDSLTEGAACTTLLAKEFINKDEPLLIANSDQYLEWNSINFYYKMIETRADGGIITFEATHPKWSFCRLDENENVVEVAEKKPISKIATAGLYYWRKGSDYVKYAEQMIQKDLRVNNEFYVAPVYNEAIADGKRIKTYNIKKMWGLGVPEDLDLFLKNYRG